jgi:hypothetical protein
METLILKEEDFYRTANGLALKGGNRILYEASLVIKFNRDGGYEVVKDRYGQTKEEIETKIGLMPDQRLLLMLG